MRAIFVGAGAVGARAARQVISIGHVDDLVVADALDGRAEAVAQALGEPARAVDGTGVGEAEAGDVVVLASPGSHRILAEEAVARGAHVVSAADGVAEVEELLALHDAALAANVHLVVGAGFSPGLSCVLATLGARAFERVDEIHVAKVGTGGPACVAQQQDSLGGDSSDWRDGSWDRRRAGSGRELCWFPDPVRAVDCYRAALAEPILLRAAFPDTTRITARLGASRRDRIVARIPKLRRPNPEGEIGALRVEVRGAQGSSLDDRVLGAVDRPAVAAGAVAGMAARWALDGRLAVRGASGLAGNVEPGPFLAALAERGVKVAVFEGGQHGSGTVAVAG